MRRLLPLLVVTFTVAITWFIADRATAGCPAHAASARAPSTPPYVTLQGNRLGHKLPVPVTRYAYGWFGAKPRHHCVRHFGYHRNFTQWTIR